MFCYTGRLLRETNLPLFWVCGEQLLRQWDAGGGNRDESKSLRIQELPFRIGTIAPTKNTGRPLTIVEVRDGPIPKRALVFGIIDPPILRNGNDDFGCQTRGRIRHFCLQLYLVVLSTLAKDAVFYHNETGKWKS